MKHGVFFFFLTPLFSVLCLGPGAVRMSWPPGRGLGCWFSLLLRGPGWSSCPRAGAKGVQLRDRALTTPLGVVVPGSRSIECIWGVWVWGTVSIFVCLHVGRGCVYSFACMRVGTFACVYGCLFVYVYVSGRALDSTSLIISVDPTPPPCPAGGGCRRCVGGFSRRGRMLGWAPAHFRRSLGGAWPYWPCWAPIGGWGAFGSPGPGPGPALVWVDCRWSLRACRHGTWGVYTVAVGGHTFGLSSALFWVEAAVVPAVVLLGVPCPGGPPDVWGPDLFHACFMPCGDGAVFPTHTIKHLHGGTLWTQARSHTQVYTQAFTLV